MASQTSIHNLKKYVPFIEYALKQEIENKSKFRSIKNWIEIDKNFKNSDLINMEKAITLQFRKLTMDGNNIPEEFIKLFNKNKTLTESTVDLCSEDETEENNRISVSKKDDILDLASDDEVEIVSDNSILIRPEEKAYLEKGHLNNNNNNERNKKNKNSYDKAKHLPKSTLICIDDSSSDEERDVATKSNSTTTNNNVGEGVLFQRREKSDIPQYTAFDNLKQQMPDTELPNGTKQDCNSAFTNNCPTQQQQQPQQLPPRLRLNDPRVAKAWKTFETLKKTPLGSYLNIQYEPELNGASKIPCPTSTHSPTIPTTVSTTVPATNDQSYVPVNNQQQQQQQQKCPRTYKEYKELKRKLEEEAKNNVHAISRTNHTVEPPCVNINKVVENAESAPVASVHKKTVLGEDTNISKTSKVLKDLECSIKGFDDPLRHLYTPPKKRSSSLHARSSIALQLNDESDTPPKRARSKSPNYDENPYIKRYKLTNCFVSLQRLPHEVYLQEMQKLNSYNEAMEETTLHTELVVAMVKNAENDCNSVKQPRQKVKVLNTNEKMTEATAKHCVLCKSKTKYLTKHYVQFHKTESYISRLSDNDLNNLNESIPYAEPIDNSSDIAAKERLYAVECGFKCQEKLIMPFNELFDHYAKHTGEYAHKCNECLRLFADKHEKLMHRKSKTCKGKRFDTVYLYPDGIKTIYLHCCKLCNFVQLNEANTFKHLRDHHHKYNNDSSYVERVILCTMSDDDTNNKENINEQVEALNTSNAQDVLVHNEPLCEEEMVELDIKPNIRPFIHIPYASKQECLDQHQPFLIKKEENMYDALETIFDACGSTSFGFYKCMGAECCYTTDIDAEMLEHVHEHLNSYMPDVQVLTCAYCSVENNEFSSAEELVAHIKAEHYSRRYQCASCEYRSSAKDNVLVHFQIYHSENAQDCEVIYECEGPPIDLNQRKIQMLAAMERNVQPLSCQYCDANYFSLSAMRLHYAETHEQSIIEELQLKAYSCIYCKADMSSKADMQHHIALEHPDELNFGCYRELSAESANDCVQSLQLVDITVIDAEMIKVVNVVDKTKEIIAENEPVVKDEKPTPEMLLHMQLEVVKASLKKLTAQTGIPPDRLYICRDTECCAVLSSFDAWHRHMLVDHCCMIYSCPHCQNIYATDDLKQLSAHFLTHSRHTYLCYDCGQTFVTEAAINQHAASAHTEQEMRLERVQFNRKYAYFISISNNLNKDDYFVFLCDLQQALLLFIQKQKDVYSQQLRSKWPVPLTESCLDDYVVPQSKPKKFKCFISDCEYDTPSLNELLNHFRSHNLENRPFACFKCNISFPCGKKYEYDIIQHIMQHFNKQIYVCGVCEQRSFHIKAMLNHTVKEHNKRDVFIVSVARVEGRKIFGLTVVFAEDSKTFNTTKTCFCCPATNIECLVIHLREEHQIVLCYGCALCNEMFSSLSNVEQHYVSKHAEHTKLKLFAILKSCNNLLINGINPLKLECDYLYKKSNVADERSEDKDILAIYEGDDLIIAKEIERINESQKQTGFKINCINVSKLQQL